MLRSLSIYHCGAGALGLATLALAHIANACPPPPPIPGSQRAEGESEADYRLRLQQIYAAERERAAAEMRRYRAEREAGLWASAEQIVAVEVTGVGHAEMRDNRGEVYGASPKAELRVVLRERGEGATEQFSLTYAGDTSCGPYGPITLTGLAEGQIYIVFARNGALDMTSVASAVREDEAVDPATLALIDTARQVLAAQ